MEVAITDSGSGLPEEIAVRRFEAFQATRHDLAYSNWARPFRCLDQNN